MKVFIEKENKLLELEKNCSGKELLTHLKINPSTVILIKNNEVVLDSENLENSDEIKILSVISGG
jgi:sulfur carrier protein ThiS